MTPARSLAASAVALGFASTFTAPTPTFAAPAPAFSAPIPCEQAQNYAAQSGAETLRIGKLEVTAPVPSRISAKTGRPEIDEESGKRVLGDTDPSSIDPTDSDTISEGIGMFGDAALDYLNPSDLGGRGAGDVISNMVPSLDRLNRLDRREQGADGGGGGWAKAPGEGPDADAGSDSGDGGRAGNGRTPGGKGDDQGGNADGGRDGADLGGRDGGGDGRAAARGRAAGRGAPGGEAGEAGARGRTATVTEVGVGEARTAMIANAPITSAAYARMLDASADGKGPIAAPLVQQAPPSNTKAAKRVTPAASAGPIRLGNGRIDAHARWTAEMACGEKSGKAGDATSAINGVSILGRGESALFRVPGKAVGESTTELERRGETTRSVASATVTAGGFELAGGKVRVRVLRAPKLVADASAKGGGRIDYRPAQIEVTGAGVPTNRLTTAGDQIDIDLGPEAHALESSPLSGLTELRKGKPLPLPSIPGLPTVTMPELESAPSPTGADAQTPGTRIRIGLGEVRKASQGNAIAAKATAIRIAVTKTVADRGNPGYRKDGAAVTLNMGIGLLEAAAVAPEPKTRDTLSSAGSAGGLPITGPRLDVLAMAGSALLALGAAAVFLTTRRRRSHP